MWVTQKLHERGAYQEGEQPAYINKSIPNNRWMQKVTMSSESKNLIKKSIPIKESWVAQKHTQQTSEQSKEKH